MTPDKEQFEELSAAYALGALDAEELAIFEETLAAGGDEYQKIFRESIGVSYLINTGIRKATPSPLIKAKLIKNIHRSSRSSFSYSLYFEQLALTLGFGNPRFGLVVSFLLLIVIGEVGTYAYFLYDELDQTEQQITSFESKIQEQHLRLISLTSDQQLKEEVLTVLQSPKIELVIMNGQEINPPGYGKIILDPVRSIAILHVSNLPSTPTDKEYQLWFNVKDQKPVSGGVFSVEKENENYFKVSKMPMLEKKDITAFVVTMEPKGGAPQPTGAAYLLGSPASKN